MTPPRRLLAVSWCMPPGLFPRSIQVARLLKGLSRLGWSSSVITPAPSSRPSTDPVDGGLAQAYGSHYETIPISLSRVDDWYGPPVARWRQRIAGEHVLTPEQLWTKRAVDGARHFILRNRVDLLATFAQPWSDHQIGLDICAWHPRLPWVAHFSDPWVDSLYDADAPAPVKARARAAEAQVVARASAVVFTNAYAAELVMAKYPAALRAKAHVVPHAIDTGYWRDLLEGRPVPAPRPDGPLRLSHVGNLFVGRRRAHAMFEALELLQGRRPLEGRLEFVLMGEGSGQYEARERVFERRLEPLVTFHSRVSYADSLRAMAGSHALVLIDAPAPTSVFMPSKVVDYLMVDRPILALTPSRGASAEMMTALGYPIIDPEDPRLIAEAIERLMERHEAGTLAPSPATAAYARQFELDEASRACAAVLDGTYWGSV